MSIKSQSSRIVALVAACLVSVTLVASAQLLRTSKGVNPTRILIGAFNGTDTLIVDGTLVMIDTLTAAQGKGVMVRPFSGTCLDRNRTIGIAFGNLPVRASQSPGQVLVYGVHNNAKVGSSTLALNVGIRPGLLHGKLSTANDTSSLATGWVIGFSPSNTASNPRAQVFFTSTGRNGGQL